MKNKHLKFDERLIIEENLNKGVSIHRIALILNRPDSTIVREIKKNRYIYKPSAECCKYLTEGCNVIMPPEDCPHQNESGNKCVRYSCKGCQYICSPELCGNYVAHICPKLCQTPFVCNGCENVQYCHDTATVKYKYQAKMAQRTYEDTLKESRTGISLSNEEMKSLDDIVSPLLFNGHSIRAIYLAHKDELPCSEVTLYRYVDRCYLTARNIDMPRKVRFKTRYHHGPRSQSFQSFVSNRSYADFTRYIEENTAANVWEMDTVIGSAYDTTCLLTLLCRKTTFMIAVLLQNHTQEAVINALNDICRTMGIELFRKIFSVILTDRGTEFGNPHALECTENGEERTKVFYCDAYCSWQKGMIEKNHEFIRMVLPKGKSFKRLSQKDIHLLMTHINNYPRESLNGVTPYELSKLLLGQEFLAALKFHKLHSDDVILKPFLLRKTFTK